MPSSLNNKTNHMMEYYRKQSDRKMLQTIINMKSQFHHHFTESIQRQNQNNKKINKHKINPNKNHQKTINQAQLLQKQQIHLQNQRIVLRLQHARYQSSRDYQKYLDFTINQRLLKTRNVFRKRAKDETKNKICNENDLLKRRLMDTRSSYSFQGHKNKKRLSKQKKQNDKYSVYCRQDKLTHKNPTLRSGQFRLDDDELGSIIGRNTHRNRVKTESISTGMRFPKGRLSQRRDALNNERISLQNCDRPFVNWSEMINLSNQGTGVFPQLRVGQRNRKQSKTTLERHNGLREQLQAPNDSLKLDHYNCESKHFLEAFQQATE